MIRDEYGNSVASVSKFLGKRTNNFAEYEAVILAFQALMKIIPKAKRKVNGSRCEDGQRIRREADARGIQSKKYNFKRTTGAASPHRAHSVLFLSLMSRAKKIATPMRSRMKRWTVVRSFTNEA